MDYSKFHERPFSHFSCEDLGVDPDKLIGLDPCFEELEWDMYDVRRAQLKTLSLGLGQTVTPQMIDFYLGNTSLEKFLERIGQAPSPEVLARLKAIAPYRKRAMSQFNIELNDPGLSLHPAPDQAYVQPDTGEYQRSLPRKYASAPEAILQNQGVKAVIQHYAQFIRNLEPSRKGLNVMIHPTSVVCEANKVSLPSLEGIHCDGADFIISALVISRTGIQGGQSVIYSKDREEIYRTTLKPGEGIFQSDKDLLHDATPVTIDETVSSTKRAVRNMIGFDFNFTD